MQNALEQFQQLPVQFFKLLLFFTAVVLPAVWVCVRRLTDQSMLTRIALGVASGFGLFVVEAWYVGLWSLDGLFVVWLVHYAVATWLGMRPAAVRECDIPRLRPPAQPQRLPWLALLPMVVSLLPHFYALHFSKLPPGVDASFHCVVALRQLDASHATTDLWPLEELKLNYPIGSHLWLAVAARWTGLEVHEVFRHSFAIAVWGAALCIGAWSEMMFGSTRAAVAAPFVFVFASYQSSLLPYTWGGLPTLLAMWLALGACYFVFYVAGGTGLGAAMLLLAAMAMSHHHTMVAVFGGLGAVATLAAVVQPQHRAACRRVLASLAGAAVLAGVYLGPLLTRATELDDTGTLAYLEPFSSPWAHLWSWGPALLATASLGLWLSRDRSPHAPRMFLIGLAIFWLACFVGLDYASRAISMRLQGNEVTPFTPSRFLFDIQFVLAIFAAGGLVKLWDWFKRVGFRYALIVGIACWGVWKIEPNWHPVPSDALLPIGRWIRENLPADAFVFGPIDIWLTYVCDRESTSLFTPISEPRSARRQLKDRLLGGAEPLPADEWRQRLGKPIYAINRSWDTSLGTPIYTSGVLGVYEISTDDGVSRDRD